MTGTGIDVAVIDTGVDDTHPALDGGTVVGGHDFANDDDDPMDDNGHGTHVAGIVAANGDLTGVAPGASIVAYKVLNRNGSGPTSDVLAGLEAAVDPANPHRAEVVNFSLGGAEPADGPLTSAAQAAAEAGVVVVASAGNDGPGAQTVSAPGQAPGVLSVGASISGLQVPALRMVAPEPLDLQTTRWEPSANPPQDERELDVVDIGGGGLDGHDVAGKAVLMDAPGPPTPLALEAERRGAVALLMRGGVGDGPVLARRRAVARVPHRRGDDGRFDSLVAVIVDDDSVTALREALASGPVRVGLSGEDATDEIADVQLARPDGDVRREARPRGAGRRDPLVRADRAARPGRRALQRHEHGRAARRRRGGAGAPAPSGLAGGRRPLRPRRRERAARRPAAAERRRPARRGRGGGRDGRRRRHRAVVRARGHRGAGRAHALADGLQRLGQAGRRAGEAARRRRPAGRGEPVADRAQARRAAAR